METISLHLGVAHFKTPTAATEALQAALQKNETYYGPNEGTQVLREAIAQRYQEDEGIQLSSEEVLITHGTKHALHLYLQSLLNPGDEVVMLAPYWFAFPELIRLSGGKLTSIPANPEENYALPLEKLRQTLSQETRLLILTTPGNPTGKVYSTEELSALAELLEAYPNLHVLSDEIYDGLVYDTSTHSLLKFDALRNRVSVVNGFSKSFAMSGWRVGYLIAPPEVLQRATALQLKLISGVSPLTQAGAAATLQNRHAIWQEFKADLLPKREQVMQALRSFEKLLFFVPEAGYYVCLDVSGYLQEQDASSPFQLVEEWAAALKDQVGLEVLPSTNMGSTTLVRMSFALPQEILDTALDRLTTFLRK